MRYLKLSLIFLAAGALLISAGACTKKSSHDYFCYPAPANRLVGTWYDYPDPDNSSAITFNKNNTLNFISIGSYDNGVLTFGDQAYTTFGNAYELEGTWSNIIGYVEFHIDFLENGEYQSTISYWDSGGDSGASDAGSALSGTLKVSSTFGEKGTYKLNGTALYLINGPVEYSHDNGILTSYNPWEEWRYIIRNYNTSLTIVGTYATTYTRVGSGEDIVGTWKYQYPKSYARSLTYTFTADNYYTYKCETDDGKILFLEEGKYEHNPDKKQLNMSLKTVSQLDFIDDDLFSGHTLTQPERDFKMARGKSIP